jgi:ATP-binding cassette subfamily B protein
MLKTFISYYKNHQVLFYLDLLAATIMSGLNLLFPVITNNYIDDYIPNENLQLIITFGFVMIGLYIVRLGCNFFVNYYGHVMGTRIERDMRIDLFKKIQTLDSNYFDEHKTGSIMTYIVGHLRDISEMSHHTPENLFVSLIMLTGSFIILVNIHVLFTFIVFFFILLLVIFSAFRRKKMMNASRRTRATHEDINSEVENSIGGIRLTKAFTNEDFELNKFTRVTDLYQDSYREFYFQMGVFSSGTNFFIDMLYVSVLVFGGYFVYLDQITIGNYVAFFMFLNYLIQPIRTLIMTIEQVQKGWSGYEKFYKIMEENPTIVNPVNPVFITDPKGKIELKNVTFQYESSHNDVLTNFSLSVDPGQKVALVGETGVGKSTVSKLIPRFYDVQDGEVLIDNVNVKNIDLFSLRSNIGHVQQDVYIFFGSVKDNILYGRPEASYNEVVESAKQANIHDFIMTLDHGYETLVGERGVKLSGGQKQRISIARVFLKNPPILILDEATSSLDNITERLIQKSLDKLSKGRTTIVIAHRLSTIQNSDKILVLSKDGITEQGTHEELVKQGNYYAALHNSSL